MDNLIIISSISSVTLLKSLQVLRGEIEMFSGEDQIEKEIGLCENLLSAKLNIFNFNSFFKSLLGMIFVWHLNKLVSVIF